MRHFFSQLFKNLAGSFGPKKIWWHILAIALTYVVVRTDFDWWYFTHTRGVVLQYILFPAALIGGFMPLVAPFALYAWGAMNKSMRALQAGFAVGQAALLGFVISGTYKAFTGRVQPPLHPLGTLIDDSFGFRFGFLRGGVFWGWPSTHTTMAFAMAIALFTLFPKNKWVRFFSVAYALYIGIGVSTNIHWFSDFVAGAIIGSVIGVTVGKSYLAKLLVLKSEIV